MWTLIARICAIPFVRRWLKYQAFHRPYSHIPGYMLRYWLFNPYDRPGHVSWLPSVRVHCIQRPDKDRHLHDHPWNARSIILQGGYTEVREGYQVLSHHAGDTVRLPLGVFHSITSLRGGPCWTLFITYGYRHTWGFKVPWREYLNEEEEE